MGHGTPMGAMANNNESKITPKALIHQWQTWEILLYYHMTTTSPMETLYKASPLSKFSKWQRLFIR